MKNLKDAKTTIYPSTMRGGKELPSSSALDSPSVMSKLATPKPTTAMNSDMSHVIDDATSAMHDTYDETTMLDTTVPLGEFLDEQISKSREREISEPEHDDVSDDEPMPSIPEGYLFNAESFEDVLTCQDKLERKRLLIKWSKESFRGRMRPDPAFATSPICVPDQDYYDITVDPDIITLVESDPFYGYESETVVAHLRKLDEIAALFTNSLRSRHFYILKIFPFSLKGDAKKWFNSLDPACVQSPQDMIYYFSAKYFPAHKKQAALRDIYNFVQIEEEVSHKLGEASQVT